MTKRSFRMTFGALASLFSKLKSDRKGNVMMIMGFAIVPLTFVAGFGVDYGRAMRLQTQLNAAADAAALAAVAPAMIFKSNSASSTAASNMFNSQAARLSGYENLVMTPVITDGTTSGSGSLGFLRKAEINYTAQSVNFFGGILGASTLTVNGSATASAAQPPNVDFYLAMDNSPSMLLPSTSLGIERVIAATTNSSMPEGCAFACHAKLPHTDNIFIRDTNDRRILHPTDFYNAGSAGEGVYFRWDTSSNTLFDADGNSKHSSSTSAGSSNSYTTGRRSSRRTVTETTTTVTEVSYTITDNNNGPVRINRVERSTPTTQTSTYYHSSGNTYNSTSTGSPSTSTTTFAEAYWADGYWLTHNYGEIFGTPARINLRVDDVVDAATQLIPFAADQASEYQVTYRMQMYSFDWTHPGASSPVQQLNSLTDVSSYPNNFQVASIFPADDYWWKNNQPTAGSGNNDRATETLNMLQTMNSNMAAAGSGAPGDTPQKIFFLITDGMIDQQNGGGRYLGPLRSNEQAICTAIKAKGIKIAILYTQYLPESLIGDSWSQANVAPFLPPPPAPFPAGNAGNSDQVLTALQTCASPGTSGDPLVQTVTADDSIQAALQQLFATTLQSARLVQ